MIDEGAGKSCCQDCDWVGAPDELIAVPMPLANESLEINQDRALEIAKEMSEQYMKLLYQVASKSIGRCIFHTGLVGKQDTEGLTRLIRAACMGAHRATLDEAEKIASERKASRILS